VSRFFDIDAANAALTELQPILVLLRDHREALIRLRDRVLELQAGVEIPSDPAAGSAGRPAESADREEIRRIRLRMQGLIDQMQAGVLRIDEMGVTLRDIESGLIDFPALVNGRQVWLCWRLEDGPVAWWHELTSGFADRRRLDELS
jgi:hypothetical protein